MGSKIQLNNNLWSIAICTILLVCQSVHLEAQKNSLFEFIHSMEGMPTFSIITDMEQLREQTIEEKYQKAAFIISDDNQNSILDFSVRLRTRGNARKQVCGMPPLKIDFPAKSLDSLGFLKQDKIKLVFACSRSDDDIQMLYKEYFLYDLFRMIHPDGIRARLVQIKISDVDQEAKLYEGLIVEDEVEYARRLNIKVMQRDEIERMRLDRDAFLKVLFFQYMIANTDWTLSNLHNIELVKYPNRDRFVPVPYDFDFSGFVGQSYAHPHSSLPIKSIHDRYFFPFQIKQSEFETMTDYFLSIEDEVYLLCDRASYMSSRSISQSKKYLKSFFDLLRKPKKIKASIVPG